jgi:serine/threonine-protein kinase
MAQELSPGETFASYRVEGLIGHGGMATVYRASAVESDEPIALKVIADEFGGDPVFRARFEREARLMRRLRHPNVVALRKAGSFRGVAYLAMELVDGVDLNAVIALSGGLHPRHAATVIAEVASALDAAHARGLVHRDVKPGNVLLARQDDGVRVCLTDFGLSRERASDSGLTATGHWVGTVDYAAPEQLQALPTDARSDVYGLGCVLYKALTGELPFPRQRDLEKVMAHLTEPPPAPSTAGAPESLDPVVARAMAKSPDDRYQTAGELGDAALAAVEGGPQPKVSLLDVVPIPAAGGETAARAQRGPGAGDAPTAA